MSLFTAVEKRILTVITKEPHLPISALAAKARCTKSTVYQRLQSNPAFRQAFNECMITTVLGDAPAIIGAFTSEALLGSFPHGKMLLEIAGVYQKKQQVDADIRLRDEGPVFKSDREKMDFLRATLLDLEAEDEPC